MGEERLYRTLHPETRDPAARIFRAVHHAMVASGIAIMLGRHRGAVARGTRRRARCRISHRPRNATIVAARHSTLLRLDIADFRHLLGRQHELARIIRAAAEQRLEAPTA